MRVRNCRSYHYTLPRPADWLGALPSDILLTITQFYGVKAALTVFQALTRRCASYALSRLIGGDNDSPDNTTTTSSSSSSSNSTSNSSSGSSVGGAMELFRLPPHSIILALQYLPPQTRLDFSRCRTLALDSLPPALPLRALQSLALRDVPVPTGPLHALLSSCPALKSLDLSNSSFSDAAVEALAPAHGLVELSLSNTRLRGVGLVTVLRLCPRLRKLEARKLEITPPAAAALRAHPALEEVDLSESRCRSAPAPSAAPVLGRGVGAGAGKGKGHASGGSSSSGSGSGGEGGGADLQFHSHSPLHTLRWLKCPGTMLLVAAPRLQSLHLDGSQLFSLQLDTPALETLTLGGCKGLRDISLLPPTGGAERDWASAVARTAVIGSSGGFPAAWRAAPDGGPLLPRLLRLELRGVVLLRGYLSLLWAHAPALQWLSLRDGAQWRADLEVAARADALRGLRELLVADWDGVPEGTQTRLVIKTSANVKEAEESAAAVAAVRAAMAAGRAAEAAEKGGKNAKEEKDVAADPAAALFAREELMYADANAAPLAPPPSRPLLTGPQPWATSSEWGRGAALVPQGPLTTWNIMIELRDT